MRTPWASQDLLEADALALVGDLEVRHAGSQELLLEQHRREAQRGRPLSGRRIAGEHAADLLAALRR